MDEDYKAKYEALWIMTVIWFLQEHLHVLPDHYEKCDWCGELYDSDCEGTSIDESDEYDQWYQDCGICPGVIKRLIGTRYCDSQCELQALHKEESEGLVRFRNKTA